MISQLQTIYTEQKVMITSMRPMNHAVEVEENPSQTSCRAEFHVDMYLLSRSILNNINYCTCSGNVVHFLENEILKCLQDVL